VNYITIVGVFQALTALCLAAFVGVRKTDDRDSVLSLLLLSIFLHLGTSFILNVFLPGAEIHKQFNTFIALFYPVLLWFYTSRLAGLRQKWEWRDLLHFLPAGLGALCYFIIAGYTIAHNGKTPAIIQPYNSVSGYVYIVLCTVYPAKCLKLTSRIPSFWGTEKRFVMFVSILFLAFSVYMVSLVVAVRINPLLWEQFHLHLWSRIILYSLLLLICASAAFIKVHVLYILQVETAQKESKEAEILVFTLPEIEESGNVDKYTNHIDNILSPVGGMFVQEIVAAEQSVNAPGKQPVSGIDYIAIVNKVERLMLNDRVYTNPELTLDALASMIKVSRHHLSESINRYLGKTFYQYVNELRIGQVLALMDEYREKGSSPNILSLAFEAGFHSKSSFNQYFKKMVDCTPSAYMKRLAENVPAASLVANA